MLFHHRLLRTPWPQLLSYALRENIFLVCQTLYLVLTPPNAIGLRSAQHCTAQLYSRQTQQLSTYVTIEAVECLNTYDDLQPSVGNSEISNQLQQTAAQSTEPYLLASDSLFTATIAL